MEVTISIMDNPYIYISKVTELQPKGEGRGRLTAVIDIPADEVTDELKNALRHLEGKKVYIDPREGEIGDSEGNESVLGVSEKLEKGRKLISEGISMIQGVLSENEDMKQLYPSIRVDGDYSWGEDNDKSMEQLQSELGEALFKGYKGYFDPEEPAETGDDPGTGE